KYHLPKELTKQEILDITIMRYLLNTNSFKKYMPVTIATNVSEQSIAAIMENQNELQGIDVVEDSMRQYIDEESMGPVLGYIGKASAEELESLREQNPDYPNDAVVGKAGIEQYMELNLQGTDGEETVTVDNLGKVLKIDNDTVVKPTAGNDVYLTIDSDWQSAIYEILKQRVTGILLSKIEAIEDYDYELYSNAAMIKVPIFDVYNALVANSVIDITKFSSEDASETEKALQKKFEKKQDEVFKVIRNRLTADYPPAFKDEDEQYQEYFDYICNDMLQDTLGIIARASVDTSDKVYISYIDEGEISLKEYLTYAASQNWIDISRISSDAEYLDSQEVYTSLTDYILDYLRTDTAFSKKLYYYMLHEHTITGQELCLVLYEQAILSKEDEDYQKLASGSMSAYDFMIDKLWNLDIEPADLALAPCSASAVLTDVNTGEVIACVSYPGYDNNRRTNNMDVAYYSKLAMDLSSPFFNKATQQQTAPGSTMKLLSTIAGMQEGVIDDNTYFNCTGLFEFVEPPIHCWNELGHGSLEIRMAIQESCNYFFNMVGFQIGKTGDNKFSEAQSLERLQYYASTIGLDQKTGIELTEATPKVSDSLAVPSYIGQGTHLYTTTQLARYASTLANSGTVYNLSLLDKVVTPSGETVTDYTPQILTKAAVPQNVWDDIHDGMRRVVQTHEQFDDLRMDISGKTG
ncbi:MAG: peptidase, partial [Lachnospiraceae bacterium]|nr:peptidase [Lachnospiraceae bacterium]